MLGTLNVGAFFVLIYLAAQLLPTSLASMVMAVAPIAMMVLAAIFLAERPAPRAVGGALIGISGVTVMLAGAVDGVSGWGVLASIGAMTMSSLGYVLAKRWNSGVDLVSATGWQLVAGGLLVLPVAVVFEGSPPPLSSSNSLGYLYVTVVATAIAFLAWFGGLRRLPAGTVGLIGLLNPVTGVVLGWTVAHESASVLQISGAALVVAGIVFGQRAGRTPSARPADTSPGIAGVRPPAHPAPLRPPNGAKHHRRRVLDRARRGMMRTDDSFGSRRH